MSKTVTSGAVTFMDITDSRRLEVYITANHPTVQIYDQNDGNYTPDWSKTNLKLSAKVYLNSEDITDKINETDATKKLTLTWSYKQINVSKEVPMSADAGDATAVTIANNILTNSNLVTDYICKVAYQGLEAFSKITFSRVDTGKDGSDGDSVRILGTAVAAPATDKAGYYTITYNSGAVTAANLGDGYIHQGSNETDILNGHLFVCAILNDNITGNDYFIDVGNIKGPAGQDGTPAKLLVLSGTSQVFKFSSGSTTPSPETIDVTAQRINIPSSTTLTWTYNGSLEKPSYVTIGTDKITINGKNMTSNSLVVKVVGDGVEDVFTVYKASDGSKGDAASMAFLTNENTSFHADAEGLVQTLTTFQTNVVSYNGTTKTTPTIGAITNLPSGMSVTPNKGTAYAKVELTPTNATITTLYSDKNTQSAIDKTKLANGDSFVVGDYLYKYDKSSNSFKSTVTTIDNVSYLDRIVSNNEITLIFTISSKSKPQSNGLNNGLVTIPITSPVSTNLLLSWSKINAGPKGEEGVGIRDIEVVYGVTSSSSTRPADADWKENISDLTIAEGSYLWTRTTIDYTDDDKDDTVTYTYIKQGSKGDTGTSLEKVEITYAVHSSSTTPPTSGWTSAIQAATSDKQYLWTKTTFTLEDGTTSSAYSVAKQGRGIDRITEYYLATSASSNVTTSTSGWKETIQTVTFDNKYLWNYETILYTDGTSSSTSPTIIGVYGNTGATGATGPQGNGISSIEEWYLATSASSGVTTSTSGWKNTVQSLTTTNKYLWNYEIINYTNGSKVPTSPVIIGVYGDKGDKGDQGDDGIGIASTTVTYGVSDSSSAQPSSWQNTIPTVADGKYLWTRTIIDYTDTAREDTVSYTYAKQGAKGETGSAGSSVTVTSIQYQEGASATTAPTGTWSNSVVSVADGKYLWTKITFSDGKTSYAVAKQGSSGRGVSSIAEEYYQSTSATAQSGGSWSTTVPTWADGKYIWTRSVITYTDNTTSTTTPVCVTGQKGATGGTGATGSTGVGVSSVDVWYYQSTSSTSLTGGTWSTTAPTWADGKYVWTKTITTYTNNTTDETDAVCITGQKGATGVGVKSVTEYYLATASSSSVTSSTSGWTTAVQTITSDKKYLWNYEVITYTNDTTSSTSPVIIGAFGNTGGTGATGKGIKSVTEYYLASTSASGVTTSTTGWTTTMQALTATNKYLWNYELLTYTDNSTATIAPVIIGVYGDKGDKGSTGDRGAGINSVTVTYGTSTAATTQPTTWQSTLPTVAEGSYLWTRTVTDYTDTAIEDTVTLTYAKQGAKGSTGTAGTSVTVSSIQYQDGTSATTAPTGTWSDTVVTVSAGSYLWTKTTFSDGKIAYGVARQGSDGAKGATGSAGADAYTVLLTNESHVFAGDTANALASTATTQVLAYKGTTAQTVTIVSVNGVTAATASTATGITGLSFACSALSGTTPTITFTCTTAFVSQSGSIPIVLSVGGVSITKMFTYSIAFKGSTGATGGTGSAGAAATAYWLISDASVVQKSNSGSVVLTPSTLTFTGKSKTGTSAPADYACRWIIAYSTDGSTYTNSYTSSANEASKTFTVDASYKSIRVRMYLAGGTSTLLDEQIIPVVADGAVGTPGMDAVTFQIYSSNGYALSTSTPNVTLQTFAYVGDVAITAGATYQWYKYSTSGWTAISGATNAYLDISRDDVAFSQSYMCKMTFNGVEYTSVATIDDKNDNNKVFTTKPSNYAAGDIWIVGSDYVPSGVEVGTLLKAQYTNTSYADADWIKATKYDDQLKDIRDDLTQYNQYFSFSSADGVKITAKDSNGVESKYSTTISNDEWAINYGSEAVTYVNGTKMHIKEAEIESPLSVTGKYSGSTMLQAPVINLGNFSLVIESNGSMSIVVKS